MSMIASRKYHSDISFFKYQEKKVGDSEKVKNKAGGCNKVLFL